MSMDAHLSELVRRHGVLEKEIESETVHTAGDDLKITELKRKKLLLKEKIERLKRMSPVAADTLH